MGSLTAATLLDAWEGGLTRPLAERVLTLLAAAFPDMGAEELRHLPIGRRDARLMQLRERLFGPDVVAVSPCPVCRAQIESSFRVGDICSPDEPALPAWLSVDAAGCRATFRLPTTDDLLAFNDADAARTGLLVRCVSDVRDAGGDAVPANAIPSDVMSAIEAHMAAVDPQADIELALFCSACGHRWSAPFDIASFLWKEVHAWALRTLRDVHRLARSYGWREADVLSLSPTRRQLYLDLSWP